MAGHRTVMSVRLIFVIRLAVALRSVCGRTPDSHVGASDFHI